MESERRERVRGRGEEKRREFEPRGTEEASENGASLCQSPSGPSSGRECVVAVSVGWSGNWVLFLSVVKCFVLSCVFPIVPLVRLCAPPECDWVGNRYRTIFFLPLHPPPTARPYCGPYAPAWTPPTLFFCLLFLPPTLLSTLPAHATAADLLQLILIDVSLPLSSP